MTTARRTALSAALAGLALIVEALLAAPAASASPAATLGVRPAFGPPGAEVTVRGTGFGPPRR